MLSNDTPQRHEEIRVGQLAVRFLMEGHESGGSVAMFEFDVPAAGNMPIAHSHDGYDETIFGIAGVLTLTVDGRRIDIGPGEAFCIRRGAIHRFDNHQPCEARMLAIVTPGILRSDYFREIAAILVAAAGGPPDFRAIAEVMLRHGLTPAK